MSGIFTYYVSDLRRRMHMHMFDCFLLALSESAWADTGDGYILHFVWFSSLSCTDLGIWLKNCNYFFPHSIVVALVFLSLVLHIIPSFRRGRLVALHFGGFFDSKASITHSLSSMHLTAVKKLGKNHMYVHCLLNCPFQNTSSCLWEEKLASALVEQWCFRNCRVMW